MNDRQYNFIIFKKRYHSFHIISTHIILLLNIDEYKNYILSQVIISNNLLKNYKFLSIIICLSFDSLG